MSILSIKNLSKSYKHFEAVKNLSFNVEKGQIFGLLGPNGAGKTTTIECILNLKKRDSGEVLVNGGSISDYISEIGVQFQNSFFPDRIKVYEICEMMASLYDSPEDYTKLLKEFKLYEKRDEKVMALSGGQRQKLSVLLALINKPKLVFLDELTTGLDPEARREVWAILKELQSKGLTIFLTSHYMDEVAFLCDQLLIIKEGETVITGTPEEVIQNSGKENLEDAYLHYMEVVS